MQAKYSLISISIIAQDINIDSSTVIGVTASVVVFVAFVWNLIKSRR